MDISKALFQMRKRTVHNQKEFAGKLGISQTYLSLLENGKKTPSWDLIEHYSKLVNVPIAIVFWKSIEDKDVPTSKKRIFKELKPVVDNLIDQIF